VATTERPKDLADWPPINWQHDENLSGYYLYERFDRDQVEAFVDSYVKLKVAWATNELGKPNLPPASEVPYRAVTPTNGQTRSEQTAVSASVIYHAEPGNGLPHGVTIKAVRYRGFPFSDLEVTIHDKPSDPWPEAGWICLPSGAGWARIERLGGTGEVVPGAGHHLMAAFTGLTIAGFGHPMSVVGTGFLWRCALDSPLISRELPGCWEYSREFKPESPSRTSSRHHADLEFTSTSSTTSGLPTSGSGMRGLGHREFACGIGGSRENQRPSSSKQDIRCRRA